MKQIAYICQKQQTEHKRIKVIPLLMWSFHIDNGIFLHMMLFQNTVRTELCTDCNNADFEQDANFMRKRYHARYIYAAILLYYCNYNALDPPCHPFLRRTLGGIPVSRRMNAVKCACVEKPHASAAAPMDKSVLHRR